MRIGDAVKTLPTVKPSTYANRQGVVATRYEDEIGVLVNGRVVWFLEREIEEWNGSSSSVSVGKSAKSVRGQDGGSPLSQSTPRDARTAECTGQGGEERGSGDGSLGTQERAREETVSELAARESGEPPGEWVPGSPQRLVTNPPRGVKPPEWESSPEPLSPPSWPAESLSGLNPGERGAGGGVVARCEGCRELWERPRQRGRPPLNCPRCR